MNLNIQFATLVFATFVKCGNCDDAYLDGTFKTFGNSKYLFADDQLMTADEAKAYCNQKNYDLVSINSESENQFLASEIVKLGQENWWTAGKRVDTGSYMWTWDISEDSWPTVEDDGIWRNWGLTPDGTQEPNNAGGNEDCIFIIDVDDIAESNGTWHDIKCNTPFAFICESQFTEGATPTCLDNGCYDLWGGFGTCVDLHHNKWSWIADNFNISIDSNKVPGYENKKLCTPSPEAYEDPNRDCCRCFYDPKPPCSDNGCEAQGGLCVNLIDADLRFPNIWPRNTVDLDKRLEEGLCHKPQEPHCCDCYQLKDEPSVSTSETTIIFF